MEYIDKKLFLINEDIKNVQYHKKSKKTKQFIEEFEKEGKEMLDFYNRKEAELKELKKKIIKIKKEQEKCQIN